MKHLVVVLVVLAGISTFTGSDPVFAQMFQHDMRHTGVYDTRGVRHTPKLAWQYQTDGPIAASPVVAGDLVIIGSCDGNVYALEKKSGERRWQVKLSGRITSTVAVAEGIVVVVGGEGACYGIDAAKGSLIWRTAMAGDKQNDPWDYFYSSPTVQGSMVVYGSGDGNVYAVNLHDGVLRWKFSAGAPVHASAVIHNDTVYIGTFDGCLYALHSDDGTPIWRFKTEGDSLYPLGEIQGSPSLGNGIVYVGSRDYHLYAVEAATGSGVWKFKVPFGWVVSTPALAYGRVFFGSSEGREVYGVDAATGSTSWTFPANLNFFSSCAVADSLVYVGCLNGKLYALGAQTGALAWEYQTPTSKARYATVIDSTDHLRRDILDRAGNNLRRLYDLFLGLGSILSSPAVDDGMVYFGSADGSVYALEEE